MRKNFAFIIALSTVILLAETVGAVQLTNTNNPDLDGIIVNVDVSINTMSVQLTNNPVINTPLGIDKFYYNLSGLENKKGKNIAPYQITAVNDPGCVSPKSWDTNYGGEHADGFGAFESHQSRCGGGYGGISNPILFTLSKPIPSIVPNSHQATMAVHIRFDTCSGWVSDGNSDGLTYPDEDDPTDNVPGRCTPKTEIPEFSSVALPIAAVIGLMLFFLNKKK